MLSIFIHALQIKFTTKPHLIFSGLFIIKVNLPNGVLNNILMKRHDVSLPTGISWEPVLIAAMRTHMVISVKNAELHSALMNL